MLHACYRTAMAYTRPAPLVEQQWALLLLITQQEAALSFCLFSLMIPIFKCNLPRPELGRTTHIDHSRRRYALGLFFILCQCIVWITAAVITQFVYEENNDTSPFLMTCKSCTCDVKLFDQCFFLISSNLLSGPNRHWHGIDGSLHTYGVLEWQASKKEQW